MSDFDKFLEDLEKEEDIDPNIEKKKEEEEITPKEDDTTGEVRRVPLSVLQKERAKRQKLEAEIAQLKQTDDTPKDLDAKLKEMEDRITASISGKATTKTIDDQISELSLDTRFQDIYDVESEVVDFATKTGISAKQAYAALYPDKLLSATTKKEKEVESIITEDNVNLRGNTSFKTKENKVTIPEKEYNMLKKAGHSDEMIKAMIKGIAPNVKELGSTEFTFDELDNIFGKGNK